jgi:hypothetical protein
MGKNETVPNKETPMTSIAASAVRIQTSSQSVPSPPCWLGEVTLIVEHLRTLGVLDAITQQVRFARRRFSGQDFTLQSDGTLRCPAGQSLRVHERRPEANASLRVVYAASIRSCRPCSLREQCQWQGGVTKKPRQVSIVLHPLAVGSAPVLWCDWSRRQHRRACMRLLADQRLEVQMGPFLSANSASSSSPLSRAQRAHYRLSWQERLLRNARAPTAGLLMIRLFGVPEGFAIALGWATA